MRKAKKFKRLLFQTPERKRSMIYLLFLSLVYGFIISSVINGLALETDFLLYSLSLSFLVFYLPPLFYGSVAVYGLKFIDRHGYTLSIFNQLVLFFGITLSLLQGPFLLLLTGFIYSLNILVVCGITERKGLVPLFFPLLYIIPVFFSLGYFASFVVNWFGLLYLILLGVVTLLTVHFIDYIFRLNVEKTPVLSLISAYLNSRPLSLPSEINIDAPLQRLFFSSDEDVVIEIPELHPGPVKEIGGGNLAQGLIELRNENGRGYFWHTPCSHEEDPTEFNIPNSVFQKDSDPDFSQGLSKMVKIEKEPFKIYGQRTEDFYLIFIDGESENDFKPEIFHEIKKREEKEIIFVDTHTHTPFERDKILHEGEKRAKILKEAVSELIEDLEQGDLYQLQSSFSVSEDMRSMVLVEEVNDEKYLFVTLNSNGMSQDLMKWLREMESDFDEVIFLTTDTHHSIHFLTEEEKIDREEIKELIEEARGKTEETMIGFSESVLDNVGVLGKEYHVLESSANIMVHLFSALIGAIYFIFSIGFFLFF